MFVGVTATTGDWEAAARKPDTERVIPGTSEHPDIRGTWLDVRWRRGHMTSVQNTN